MIILLTILAIGVIGVALLNFTVYEIIGEILIIFGIVFLVLFLIILPCVYYGEITKIKQYNSVRVTIEVARDSGAEIESAALVLKIAEMNERLTALQYWNGTIIDIFIPDAVDSLELLK